MSTYNGWKNYETWAVNLWIDNEEGTQTLWAENTADVWRAARMYPSGGFTVSETARLNLTAALKDWAEESAPDLGASVWADLLNAALGEVDWTELADSMLSTISNYEALA